MLQFVELCRLCAQIKRNKTDLFAQENTNTEVLMKKITFCLSIHITKEDMLPKMICFECQRSVEQFNLFRIKCQKAEERLTKMLSVIHPNEILGTQIKQEYVEAECPEYLPAPFFVDSPKRIDIFCDVNLKTVKNVKSEVLEPDTETIVTSNDTGASSNLIQIISEEIVNHNNCLDIKQPVIEIISENFVEDCKAINFHSDEHNPVCEIKIAEKELHLGKNVDNAQDPNEVISCNAQNNMLDPAAVIEVKIQETDTEYEQHAILNSVKEKRRVKKWKKQKSKAPTFGKTDCCPPKSKLQKVRKKRKELVDSDAEIDKKYLTLGENEECHIDMEEMDALIKKKNNPGIQFECEKCGKSFKFFKCLRKHRTSHENEPNTFICKLCCNSNAKNYEFSSHKCLKSHIQRKHLISNKSNFPCHLCDSILSSQGQLNAHCKRVHDHSGASCLVCGKMFKNKARLRDHLKVHTDDRPYVCDQCGQSFKWSNGLRVHMQSHKQEKNFLCSECGKNFSAKKNLIEHLNIHSGVRPHVCNYCNASFIQLSAYSKHMYVHNVDLKVHSCDMCEKSFSHESLLKQHKVHHSTLRPYSCSICCSSFRSQSDLNSHMKVHQEKRYTCTVCSIKFSRSKTLKDHMVRHTGIKHICPAPGCGKSYTQRFPLTKHFSKNHPSLKIINRMGGKKSHLEGKTNNSQESCTDIDYIRYDYTSVDDTVIQHQLICDGL